MVQNDKIIFIQEVADVTSNRFAIKLVELFRGQRIYIPSKMPHPKHKLPCANTGCCRRCRNRPDSWH